MKTVKSIVKTIGWTGVGALAANLAVFCAVFPAPRKRWEQDRYDCGVVCGYPAAEDGSPSEIMKKRVERGVELWKEHRVGYLLLSGGAVQNDHREAEVMKQYALELGVPQEYILLEKQSVSTYHNLQYAAELMEHCGFQNCVVVTSGWHLRKADHYARRARVRYVMAASKDPEDQGLLETIRLHWETNLHMYVQLWRGYY